MRKVGYTPSWSRLLYIADKYFAMNEVALRAYMKRKKFEKFQVEKWNDYIMSLPQSGRPYGMEGVTQVCLICNGPLSAKRQGIHFECRESWTHGMMLNMASAVMIREYPQIKEWSPEWYEKLPIYIEKMMGPVCEHDIRQIECVECNSVIHNKLNHVIQRQVYDLSSTD